MKKIVSMYLVTLPLLTSATSEEKKTKNTIPHVVEKLRVHTEKRINLNDQQIQYLYDAAYSAIDHVRSVMDTTYSNIDQVVVNSIIDNVTIVVTSAIDSLASNSELSVTDQNQNN